jgi:hypothetical protein
MRDFTKSLSSLSWAMTLFGLQQLTNMMKPMENGVAASKVIEAFDSVTRSTQGQMGEALGSAFQTGDKVQRSMFDLMFAMFGGQAMGSMMPGAQGMMGMPRQGGRPCGGCGDGQSQPAGGQAQGSTGWGPIPPANPQ